MSPTQTSPTLSLPAGVASRHDVSRLRVEVERYQAWSRQYQNAARRDIQYQAEQPALSDTASALIRHWIDIKQPTSELVRALELIAASAPSITITLAAPAPASVQSNIVMWVRQQLASNMLVDFRWNARLLGGMIVQTETGVYDWSHRKALLGARSQLIERLARV